MGVTKLTHPHLTTFEYSLNTAVPAYVTVGNLVAVGIPRITRGMSPSTPLDQANMVKQKLRSWIDINNLTGRIHFRGDIFNDLLALAIKFPIDDFELYRITEPQLTGQTTQNIIVIDGWIQELGISEAQTEQDDLYETDFSIAASAFTFTEFT